MADTENMMMTLGDIIAGFEKRLGELRWQRDEAERKAKEWKEKYLNIFNLYETRPFKNVKSLPTEDLIEELKRRLDYFPDGDLEE